MFIQRFLKRNRRRILSAASSQSSIWLSDKYLINSWNVSFALHNLISSWGEAFSCYMGSRVDVGDKTNCALLSPVEVKSSSHSCMVFVSNDYDGKLSIIIKCVTFVSKKYQYVYIYIYTHFTVIHCCKRFGYYTEMIIFHLRK